MKFTNLFLVLLLLIVNVTNTIAIQVGKEHNSSGEVKRKQKPSAQPKSAAKTEQEQKRPDEIVFFINDARSAQTEFAADLLIRIAQSDKVTEPAWKIELLEEAFRLAPDVQQPFKRKYSSWNPIDTRAGFLGYAFELELDALSLECRSVKAMLAIDKQKARALFNEIPKLDLKPITCEESLIYDVSNFYALMTDIAQTAFSAKEISQGEHIHFMKSQISNLVSPVQLGPMAETILALKLSPVEFQTLVYAFSGALEKISGSDRAFWFSEDTTERGINKLLAACQERELSGDDLLKAYRTYLIKQLSGKRCADPYGWFKGFASDYTKVFNDRMRLKSTKNISPISADEIKPSEISGDEKAFFYWQSPKAKTFLDKIKSLRFGTGDKPLNEAERGTAEWKTEMNDFLKDIAVWRRDDEKSEEDYFHQKCHLYVSLLELVPPGPTRDYVLRSYVSFLNEFDLQRDSRIEWFWQANYIVRIVTSVQGENRSKLIETLGVPRNPVLYLYTEMGRLAPKTYASQM